MKINIDSAIEAAYIVISLFNDLESTDFAPIWTGTMFAFLINECQPFFFNCSLKYNFFIILSEASLRCHYQSVRKSLIINCERYWIPTFYLRIFSMWHSLLNWNANLTRSWPSGFEMRHLWYAHFSHALNIAFFPFAIDQAAPFQWYVQCDEQFTFRCWTHIAMYNYDFSSHKCFHNYLNHMNTLPSIQLSACISFSFAQARRELRLCLLGSRYF